MSRTPPRSRRLAKRYYVTLARGERIRCLSLRPCALYALGVGAPLLFALGFAGAASLVWSGDASPLAMQAQQEEMQAAYEDRLAVLQEQMDVAARTGARMRTDLEAQMSELAERQQALDNRAYAIGRIAQSAGVTLTDSGSARPQAAEPNDQATTTASGSASDAIGNFAPLPDAPPPALPDSTQAFAPAKPRPDGVEIRSDHDKTSALAPGEGGTPIGVRLASLNADANRVQSEQLTSVAALASSVARSAAKVRAALTQTGLSLDRLGSKRPLAGADEAMGGPYIPVRLDVDGSPLETEFDKLQSEIAGNERIAAALPYLPLGKPLEGRLQTTSPFGVRLDPFLGRLAIHPGNDFRAAVGEPVLATAAGKVASASYDGGYGNMVEINHGDGLSTRYAHLSEIAVKVGQMVSAGEIVGRVGTTGRTTGPHLHYEVRIDGQAVDPLRFVRAGESLTASR